MQLNVPSVSQQWAQVVVEEDLLLQIVVNRSILFRFENATYDCIPKSEHTPPGEQQIFYFSPFF